MTRRRKQAEEILAFDLDQRYVYRCSHRHGQNALAHRTRLRGIEKRTRLGAFRGARLPSSCNILHRRLSFPHPRTSGDAPSGPWRRQAPRLPTHPRPRGGAAVSSGLTTGRRPAAIINTPVQSPNHGHCTYSKDLHHKSDTRRSNTHKWRPAVRRRTLRRE